MTNGPFLLSLQLVPSTAFVEHWERLYEYADERVYDENIGRRLTPKTVRMLYRWKNGGRLSQRHAATIEQHFVRRIREIQGLDRSTDAATFLTQFGEGGAIWRIFWLHLWQPSRFPIYDQHVHRAMAWVEDGRGKEIPATDLGKIRIYLDRYLPFFAGFAPIDSRRVDRALWACGKHMKQVGRAVVSTGPVGSDEATGGITGG